VFLGLSGQKPHTLPGPVDPEKRYKIGFSGPLVGPQRLADLAFVACGIQQVVGYLIGQSEII